MAAQACAPSHAVSCGPKIVAFHTKLQSGVGEKQRKWLIKQNNVVLLRPERKAALVALDYPYQGLKGPDKWLKSVLSNTRLTGQIYERGGAVE